MEATRHETRSAPHACDPDRQAFRRSELDLRDEMGRLPPDGRNQGWLGIALFPKPDRSVEQISIHLRGFAGHWPIRRDRRRTRGARCAGPLALPAPAERRAREGHAPLLRLRPPLSRRRGFARPPSGGAEGVARRASCRRTGCCTTAPMSGTTALRPSSAPPKPARKASWPSSPRAATTPASARANG